MKATVGVRISPETNLLLENLKLKARHILAKKKIADKMPFKDDIVMFALVECLCRKKDFENFVTGRANAGNFRKKDYDAEIKLDKQ